MKLMTRHRLDRFLRRNAPNGHKRLLRVCGLYIWHPPTILELLEARETLYRLKNTFKPTQVHIDQIFRLSTNFVSVSARINSLESVRARCCAFWLVLEWTNKYFGTSAPWSIWWLARHVIDPPAWCGAATTILYGGRGDSLSFVGKFLSGKWDQCDRDYVHGRDLIVGKRYSLWVLQQHGCRGAFVVSRTTG